MVDYVKEHWHIDESRVLLTGIHLMRTGEVESNLLHLRAQHPIEGLEDLIARKVEGAEKETLPASALPGHEKRVQDLLTRLAEAGSASQLPESPTCRKQLSSFLVDTRLRSA